VSMSKNYSLKIEVNGLISFKILTLPMLPEIIYVKIIAEDKECVICKVNDINIQTNCNHNFCRECINEWYDKHKTCPCCRKNIISFNKISPLMN